jgi:hypothetical protein
MVRRVAEEMMSATRAWFLRRESLGKGASPPAFFWGSRGV